MATFVNGIKVNTSSITKERKMSNWKREDQSVFYVVENSQGKLLCKSSNDEPYFWATNASTNTLDNAAHLSEQQTLDVLKDAEACGVPLKPTGVLKPWKITLKYEIAEATDLHTAEREAALNKLTVRERELLGLE